MVLRCLLAVARKAGECGRPAVSGSDAHGGAEVTDIANIAAIAVIDARDATCPAGGSCALAWIIRRRNPA